MTPIIIDATAPDWEEELEDALIIKGAEADLTPYGPQHKFACQKLAGFMRLNLTIDETARRATFRREQPAA